MARLKVLIYQLKQRFDGEYSPNVEAVWDERDVEYNPTVWNELVGQWFAKIGTECENVSVLTLEVDDKIYDAPTQEAQTKPAWITNPRQDALAVRLIITEHNDGETWTTIDAWDEYVIEDNGTGYQEALDAAFAKVGDKVNWVKVEDIFIPLKVIEGALAPWKQVHQVDFSHALTVSHAEELGLQ